MLIVNNQDLAVFHFQLMINQLLFKRTIFILYFEHRNKLFYKLFYLLNYVNGNNEKLFSFKINNTNV